MSSYAKELAEAWLQDNSEPPPEAKKFILFSEPRNNPELTWAVILQLLEYDLTDMQFSVLAAGPLEDLLSAHGLEFIERVEGEAATNAKFNSLST